MHVQGDAPFFTCLALDLISDTLVKIAPSSVSEWGDRIPHPDDDSKEATDAKESP